MFEAAELGRKVSKRKYEAELLKLRSELLEAHFDLKNTKTAVIVIIGGSDGAGKGEMIHRLNGWLDPRGVETHAFWQTSDEECEKPRYWRFWRALPARGRIGILFGSWYSEPIIQRVYGNTKLADVDSELDRIAFFERMLVDDGAIIVKLWYHLKKRAQRKALEELANNPNTHWRVVPTDWKHLKLYNKFVKISERAIRRTDAGHAPWHVIEATDRRYRELTTGKILLEALRNAIAAQRGSKSSKTASIGQATKLENSGTILDNVDLNQRLSVSEYDRALEKYQGLLSKLTWKAHEKRISNIVALEGWDAAGKGGAIRRITEAIDPRLYHVIPIAAPTDEERAHHYLWRFWRHLPRAGRTIIFDRTWYGRVLVERVEGFATREEWARAYLEINDFEEQLINHGIVLTKFWIHISKEEQLRRFREREKTRFKRYKITEEDWRNRKRWDLYKDAVNEMVAHTSAEFAPWTIVPGNDKRFARVYMLKTLCRNLERAL